ncbi:hypothetical protein N0V88_006200 [Collariella sp. IMI 366227]|nr:hypothetical protein N0V88_006200 [Collariella sp. IMI 366227]
MFAMTTTMAQAFYDNADEDTKDWLAQRLYYRELNTIYRDAPLLNPKECRVEQVEVFDRNQAPADNAIATSSVKAQSAQVNFNRTMLLDIPQIRNRLGYLRTFEKEFDLEINAAIAGCHIDQAAIFQAPDWKKFLGYPSVRNGGNLLYKGFPMVENVVFVKHPNFWSQTPENNKLILDGHCYWLSVALLLYGDASFWLQVKAEHLSFLDKNSGYRPVRRLDRRGEHVGKVADSRVLEQR